MDHREDRKMVTEGTTLPKPDATGSSTPSALVLVDEGQGQLSPTKYPPACPHRQTSHPDCLSPGQPHPHTRSLQHDSVACRPPCSRIAPPWREDPPLRPPRDEEAGASAASSKPPGMACWRCLFKQCIFVFTCISAQWMAQAQLGMIIVPLYQVGASLGTEDPGQLSWMVAAYGLTIGMFLVPGGRLGDIYGPKLLWLFGIVIGIAANIGSGFSTSPIPFDICRAIAGIGISLSLPNASAILGRTYPPGRIRTICFAILGALGPVGFLTGAVFAALLAELAEPRWIWFFTALLFAALLVLGYAILPSDRQSLTYRPFDYLGTLLLTLALGLFNFSWNQAPLVGWGEPYVYALLVVSVACGAAFYFWEKRVGKGALVPVEILKRRNLLVYLSLWVGWMSFGIFLFFTALFIRNIRGHHNALVVAAQFIPVAPAGAIAAMLVPRIINRFRGHLIFLVSMLAFLVGAIMAAVAPVGGPYWAVTFPSMILVIAGPDLSFATGQLIVSNSVSTELQGIAGGIVPLITNYSPSIGLGLAGTVERYVRAQDGTELEGYRAAQYLGIGLAGMAVLVVGLFVRMPKEDPGGL